MIQSPMPDIASRVYNHSFKLDPIVRSLLDTDIYKLLMLQTIWKEHADVPVTFSLINRTITVLNDCVLEVTNFNYDGGGPAVYFFAGTDSNYRSNAFMIGPQLNGVQWVNDTVRLPIPDGMSLDDFNSLSVWCFQFDANFGDAVL